MRLWVVIALFLAACGDGEPVNSADADAEAVDAVDMSTADVAIDAAVPDPPRALAPCEATTCRLSNLGGPPCMTSQHSDTFTAEFGVHAYGSMLWDGASTTIRVLPTAGDWTPVIILARLNGEVLFDGEIGAVRPPFEVSASGPAEIQISTVQATGIQIYVTSAEALESGFAIGVPAEAAYDLRIEAGCAAVPVRCTVNGRDTTETECAWLHYLGTRVVDRLDGSREDGIGTAARVGWWSLKEGLLAYENPIVRSACSGAAAGPLDDCATTWRVGLADVDVSSRTLPQLEELAQRLYDGAMVSGVLRTTANEAALARDDAAAVMATTGQVRASWLLRNSAVGVTVQDGWVTASCVDGAEPFCYGSTSDTSRRYAVDRESALKSIEDLQALFEQLVQ